MAIKGPANFTNVARPYNELMERTPNSVPYSDIALGRNNYYTPPSANAPFSSVSSSVSNATNSTSSVSSLTSPANDPALTLDPSGLSSGVGIGTNLNAPTISNPSQMLPNTTQGSSLTDTFLETWMRSRTWKPKAAGFYIDGRTGYIECRDFYSNNVLIEGGQIGGWVINKTQLFGQNIALISGGINQAHIVVGSGTDSAGINATGAPSDIAFWAGNTYGLRSSAPFSVTADGHIYSISGRIGGSTLSANAITAGVFQTAFTGQRVMMNGVSNRLEVYNTDNSILASLGDQTGGGGTVLRVNQTAAASSDSVVHITSSVTDNDIVFIENANAAAKNTCLNSVTNANAPYASAGIFNNIGAGSALWANNNSGSIPTMFISNDGGGDAAQVTGNIFMFGDLELAGGFRITFGGNVLSSTGSDLRWNGVKINVP